MVDFGAADSCRRGTTAICTTTRAKAPGKTTREAQSKPWGIINCISPALLRKWDIPLCFAQGIVRPANFSALRF